MAQSPSNWRSFDIPIGPTETQEFRIAEPDLRSENLNLTTWTSAYLLSRVLYQLRDGVRFSAKEDSQDMIPILELGAGTGLVGLTSSVIWKRRTVLSDLEPLLPGIAQNISLNGSCRELVTCGTLDWRSPGSFSIYNDDALKERYASATKAHLILAADVIYSEEHPKLLSKAVLHWLDKSPDARFIIMWPLRVAYLDHIREFWSILEDAGMEAIKEGKEQGEEGDQAWDDELLCEWVVWRWKLT